MGARNHAKFSLLLVLATSLISAPAICSAQLLPADDFNGKSLDEWGLDYTQWAIKTGLGEQTLPNTFDGVRYLPPNFPGREFVAELTIPLGTPLLGSPFFIFGERYDDGTEDNPADPIIDMIFDETTIRATLNGSVVLEGTASAFPDRKSDISIFSQAIPYAEPRPVAPGVNAIAGTFAAGGIWTIFDMLPLGNHTLKTEFNSSFFGEDSFTYNITVVPEPSSLLLVGAGAIGWTMVARRRTAMLARRS